MHALLVLVPTC